MLILHKIIFNFLLSILKIYESNNINSEMKFISKIVDAGNHLLGKGASSIDVHEEVKRLKYFLDEINLAIDVGANQGQYSKELLKEFDVKELHLFEPLKTACMLLRDNIPDNVNKKIVCKGLSDKKEKVKIYYDLPYSLQASVYRLPADKGNEKNNFEYIDLIKFDDYWQNELDSRIIDFIKIDAEGHDLKCLVGAKQALSKTKVVQFEFGIFMVASKTFFLDFYKFFNDLNFQLYRIRPKGLYKIDNYRFIDEHFVYANYLAVNSNLINEKLN